MNSYVISIQELAEKVGIEQKGTLSFRPFGQKIRIIIESKINSMPSGSVIYLDFSDIRFSDSSCADEVVLQVQLFLRNIADNKIICVTNINDSIKEELIYAIAYREKEKSVGRIPFLYRDKDGSVKYIGNIEDTLDKTFKLLQKRKSLTTRDVMETFDLAVNSASNRLKKLWNYGLVLREELIDNTGKQHIYELP